MSADSTYCLRVSELSKRYSPEGPLVIDRISFSVNSGESFALLGPSGCGKTTILRLISGFERPTGGVIEISNEIVDGGGRRVPPEDRNVGLVFQDYALFPHLTVRQNVQFGLRAKRGSKREQRVDHVLKILGLSNFAHRTPHELSGGQQQRVAIARSLAPSPKILLLDEPFSNLDAVMRQEARQEVRKVLQDEGVTSVIVTHDQEEALSFSDRVAVIWNGQIEQIGAPEEVYNTPRTLFVAQFLGRTNLILSDVAGDVASTPIGPVQVNREYSGSALLSLRPEHLGLVGPESVDAQAVGEIVGREFRGHDITFSVNISGSDYLVHTGNLTHYNVGDRVGVKTLSPAIILERS